MSDENNQSAGEIDPMRKASGEYASGKSEQFSSLAKRFLWADSSRSVERVIFWLGMLCVVLFVLDFIVHRHAYAPGEGLPGFYAVVGFIAFTLIVLGAAQLRRLILRNERYYSPNSVDSEPYPPNGLERLEHTFNANNTVEEHSDNTGAQATNANDRTAYRNSNSQDDSE